jgi:flagellar assembly protein FliH
MGLLSKVRVIKAEDACSNGFAVFERGALNGLWRNTPLNGSASEFDKQRHAMLEEVRGEAEDVMREAYAKGYREGVEKGHAEGKQAFEDSVNGAAHMLKAAAQAMQSARQQFLEELEPQLVELAHAMACRILQRETQIDRGIVVDTVRQALMQLADAGAVSVRVNPVDLRALRDHQVTLLEEFSGIDRMDIVDDETVSPGGCVVDTPAAHLDARIEAQLDKMLEALKDP